MRRFAVLVVAVAALTVPAASAAPKPQLVVVGTGTVSVDWTVTTSTRLDFEEIALTTKGDVVALAVEDLQRREIVGLAADAPAWQYDVASPIYGPIKGSRLGAENTVDVVDLKPGRYRLRLVSHGPSRVVVPVTKGRGATLTARAPSQGRALIVDPRIAGASASHWSTGFRFRGKAMGILSTNEHTYVFGASAMDQCVQRVKEGASPCHADPWFTSTAAFGAGAVGDGYCRSSLYFHPLWMPSGDYTAEVITTTVGVDRDVSTMLVVVEPTNDGGK